MNHTSFSLPAEQKNYLLAEMIRSSLACGKIMLSAERTQLEDYASPEHSLVESKEGHANFVTAYDKKNQELLRDRLLALLPEAKFLGEEDEDSPSLKEGWSFVVDPIDGTTNFIKDYQASSVSVCLAWEGEPIIGVVCNPYLAETFWAVKGEGAFLIKDLREDFTLPIRGKRIHCSPHPLSQGLVLFGTSPYRPQLAKKTFEMAYDYFQKALDLRRSGSAALDLCSIACGRAEVFFELILSPWDYAAGSLIVQEAGGKVTGLSGEPVSLSHPMGILARGSNVEL